MKNLSCPLCTDGKLAEYKVIDEIVFKNQTLNVELEHSICSQCREELILPQQIKNNDSNILHAWSTQLTKNNDS